MPSMKKIRVKPKTAFMCGIALMDELGNTEVQMFPTVRSLKQLRSCVHECGIAEVEVRFRRWVRRPKV